MPVASLKVNAVRPVHRPYSCPVSAFPMASAPEPKRGEIGKQTFEAVHALVHKSGMKTTEAFKKVAAETGRSVGTVQASYYRIARQTPETA